MELEYGQHNIGTLQDPDRDRTRSWSERGCARRCGFKNTGWTILNAGAPSAAAAPQAAQTELVKILRSDWTFTPKNCHLCLCTPASKQWHCPHDINGGALEVTDTVPCSAGGLSTKRFSRTTKCRSEDSDLSDTIHKCTCRSIRLFSDFVQQTPRKDDRLYQENRCVGWRFGDQMNGIYTLTE